MKMKEMLNNEAVTYEDFAEALRNADDLSTWFLVHSTEAVQDYIIEQIKDGIKVSHMLKSLEEHGRYNKTGDWCVNLEYSLDTPKPINSKKDLMDALSVSEQDLEEYDRLSE